MCGICGRLDWETATDPELLGRMVARISHRGPDSEGVWLAGPVALGHRRLSIIDTSPAGTQPLADLSGRYRIVFNGEIYNFETLRAELSASGSVFVTRTDTEVILEAYKKWGIDCLTRFNGMFAFALWDTVREELLLARDRLGKKPLYYHHLAGGGIAFASELKSLLEDPATSRRLNPAALSQYFSLSYTLTSDAIFSGVAKLPPGHYLRVGREGATAPVSYWDLARSFRNKREFRSEEEAASALLELLDDAVRLRMISDVPLGAFLSGGIDSSSVVASMCRDRDPASVLTFSAGFREKSFNELDEARQVARHLGVAHHDQVVLPDTGRLFPEIVYHADEPFADTSIVPTYLLAQFARQHVTVALTGDGGDEILAGYETYAADRIHHFFNWIPAPLTGALFRIVDRLLPVSFEKVSFDYKLRRFLEGLSYSPARAHYHWRTIFTAAEKRSLFTCELGRELLGVDPFDNFQRFDEEVADCHYLDRAMYVDLKTWLVDDILVKVDRATMAHGLEARSPFLDYRLVEFAAALPVELKMRGFQKKYLLKRSQADRLPHDILFRRKQGFSAPINYWLNGSLGRQYRELTMSGRLPFIDRESLAKLWQDHLTRKRDNGFKLLAIINLTLWAERYGATS